MLVVLDPGHGGRDPGAINQRMRVREADLNLQVGLSLHDILQFNFGYHSQLTRTTDIFLELSQRASIANDGGATHFVSLHFNAVADPSVNGFEIWTCPGQPKSALWADLTLPFLQSAMPNCPNRGNKMDRFTVLKRTRCPALLIEFGFMSNDTFVQKLDEPLFVAGLCWAVAHGLTRFINTQKEGNANKKVKAGP